MNANTPASQLTSAELSNKVEDARYAAGLRTAPAVQVGSTGSKSNLYEASHQWATRPDDERYESLQAMYDACKRYAFAAKHGTSPLRNLRVEASGDDLLLVGRTGTVATMTHHAFGQLAGFMRAPAAFLRKLPTQLAATVCNDRIAHEAESRDADDALRLLFHQNGKLVTRAITSENYDRVWNYELLASVMKYFVAEDGWRVPPARPVREGQKGTRLATEADILPNQGDFGLAVKVGDPIAPAGLYASDHDMFAFLVNQIDPVFDGQKYLNRGVFITNSEVGAASLKFKLFTYDNVCGNHIVWGVGEVTEVSVRHIKGEDAERGKTLQNGLKKWEVMKSKLPTASAIEAQISAAKRYEIAATKEDVLDALCKFAKGKSLSRLTRSTLEEGYAIAERTPRYGAPTTVWGMVNGLTEYSQTSAYADERNELDVQAGRLMEIAF